MRRFSLAAIPALLVLSSLPEARAQRGGGDWMTAGYDAQRSFWVRNDPKISLESMQKPGFQLVWKLKFDNTARQLNAIMPPVLLDFYIGYRGFRSLGFFAGSADRVMAVDVDLARVEWEKTMSSGSSGAGTPGCPGGMTAGVTRPTSTAYPSLDSGRGPGRGTPAKSGVGAPLEGAVTLNRVAPPRPARPKPRAPRVPATPASDPFAPPVQYALAVGGDGKLHALYVSNGEETIQGLSFLPPNAPAHGLVVYANAAYAATSGGCSDVPSGVWALDLKTKKVNQWKPASKSVAGNVGPAVTPDGTLYAAAGSEITALTPLTLETKGVYQSGGAEFTSSPVVFEFKGKNLVAAVTNDGRLHVANAAKLTAGALAKSAPFSAPGYRTGGLASWQDAAGVRWILAPAGGTVAASAGFSKNGELKHGALVAWKLVEEGGAYKLQPGWVSRDLISPVTPMVVNGVVFALSSGEFRPSDETMSAADRAKQSGKAVLYALDALSGKELWNSGSTLDSFVHSGGLATGGSRVYVSTYSGTQYAFGFPMEH